MSVGVHFGQADWNREAFTLFQLYTDFCNQAQKLAGYLAPLSDQQVINATGYSSQDVTDLKSGCNVANSLVLLSQGSTDATVLTQARQVQSLVGKFGGA